VNSKPFEKLPESGASRHTSDGTKPDTHRPHSRRRIGSIYSIAVLLTFVLFHSFPIRDFAVSVEGLLGKTTRMTAASATTGTRHLPD